MQDFSQLLRAFLSLMSIQFTVWGVKISLLSVFLGITLTSIVVGAVFKLFD